MGNRCPKILAAALQEFSEGHWKIYCSLWLINVLAGQNRNEVINHCGIVRMSPFKLICLYRSAELIAQLIMGHGASRAERLRASAQQLLLLTGDGGGGHLDHSRVLSYDFHVICETKPQKLNFWVYHLHSWWPLFCAFTLWLQIFDFYLEIMKS